jgi:hypothetical protein
MGTRKPIDNLPSEALQQKYESDIYLWLQDKGKNIRPFAG